eukprot:1740224-Prymnesium_polylepis.1
MSSESMIVRVPVRLIAKQCVLSLVRPCSSPCAAPGCNGRPSSWAVDPLVRSGLCPVQEGRLDDFRTSMSGNRPGVVRLPDERRT